MYVPNNRAPNYVRQKLIELQGGDESTITVGDFNTPLSEMDRSSRQKISKERVKLNNTINPLVIIDIYILLHPTTGEYIFSSLHGTFTKIHNILGHKTHHNKFQRIEIIILICFQIKIELN